MFCFKHKCCNPYRMDSPSSINTRQWERQMECSLVVGSHFVWPCCALHGSGQVCLITGYTSGLRRLSSQALTLFGGVGFIAWCLRCLSLGECWRGPRHFWKCWVRVNYGPAPRPSLKKPCAILVRLVEWRKNTVHQSAWHNHVWYHLCSRQIVSTPLDSQLSIN